MAQTSILKVTWQSHSHVASSLWDYSVWLCWLVHLILAQGSLLWGLWTSPSGGRTLVVGQADSCGVCALKGRVCPAFHHPLDQAVAYYEGEEWSWVLVIQNRWNGCWGRLGVRWCVLRGVATSCCVWSMVMRMPTSMQKAPRSSGTHVVPREFSDHLEEALSHGRLLWQVERWRLCAITDQTAQHSA